MENELILQFLNGYFFRRHTLLFEDEYNFYYLSTFKLIRIDKQNLDMYFTFQLEITDKTEWYFDFNITKLIKGEEKDDYCEEI